MVQEVKNGRCVLLCGLPLVYWTNGEKALASHKANVRSLQHTSSLPGAATTSPQVCASMADRVRTQKEPICSFTAENDLSLTISQPLVNLVRVLAQDQSALSRLPLSNAQASYMCTHGIAAQCKKQLSDKLQNRMFSLNADEATNVNNDRILNVLVRFFDEDMKKVVTQHLGPKKLNIADASAITN